MTTLREAAQQALEALKEMRQKYGEYDCQACDHADVAIIKLCAALAEPVHTRQLTDDKIGRIWFRLALPGVTETTARLIIREAEKMMRGEIQ